MPVQLPRLQQIQPSGSLPKNDRINLKVKDQSSNILNRTNQVANLANDAFKVNKAYEDEKIDTLSSEANQAYKEWSVQELQKLKNQQGDPTDAYAQYDLDEREFFEQLRNEKPDLNERVRNGVTSNLAKTQGSQRIKVLKQRGFQKEVYENNLFESDVKLAKQGLSVSAGYIAKGDKTSALQFNTELGDIKTLIAKRGLKNGTTEEVEDGSAFDHIYRDNEGEEVKVKFSKQAQARAYKDLNDGVVTSVGVLIASNKPEQARAMMEDYDVYIDAKSRAKFEKSLNKTEDESKAAVILNSVRGKSEDEQIRAIDNIKDFEVRSEALKLKQLNTSRRNSLVKNQQTVNFNAVYGVVENLRESGQLYTEKSIEDNPQIKMILSKHSLSKTQMRALKEEVKSPKISDDKALNRITDIFLGGDLQKMTSSELTEAMVGLSAADKGKFRTKFLSRRSDKAGAERTSQVYNRASKILTDKLYAQELIENDEFGKLKGDNFLIHKKSKLELIDYLDNADLGDKPSMNDINKEIDSFIAQKQKEKLFGGSTFFNWFKSEAPTTSTNAQRSKPNANPLEGLDNSAIFRLKREYKKQRGDVLPPSNNDTNFLNYVRENK